MDSDEPVEVEAEDEEDRIQHIVRILNTDLDGRKNVETSLAGLDGVGRRASRIIAMKADVDPNAIMGYLPEEDVDRLRSVVNSVEETLPTWMHNRNKDIFTGGDKHILGSDIMLTLREDLNLMKKTRSYKGIRHERGLRVRGQRTRSTGRRGAVVGVSRKKAVRQAAKKT